MVDQQPTRAAKEWRDRMRHAFFVEPDGAVEPQPHERELIEALLRRIVAREMAGPAILFMESWKPLGSITGQGMHSLTPFIGAVMDSTTWEHLAQYMERRGAITWMLQRLQSLQEDANHITAEGQSKSSQISDQMKHL